MKYLFLSFLLIFSINIAGQPKPLEFVLDMVHNNPGEKPYVTKYNDGQYLKSQGFNGVVTHWMINCAITYDNYEKNIIPKGSEERRWIEKHAVVLEQKLDSFHHAGIAVYPFTDFIVFPASVWGKYESEIKGQGSVAGGGMQARTRKPDIQLKRTQDLLHAQIEAIFTRFPSLDGLTLRFGETYLHDAPFHLGGSPIRGGKEGIEDHITMINILREEVCVKRNKKLFYRTWDFGYNFHNNPSYYLAVTNAIEPHPNLIFSIKYQQDDFHRMTPFNPCLGTGKHPQIVESQSRMEAYGKGAHPYYTGKGVIEGWPETRYEIIFGKHAFTGMPNDPQNPRGLKDILHTGLLRGIVTWSHGGGWRGPYITHEIWTDLNTFVVAQWAQHPEKTEKEIFSMFTRQLGLSDWDAALFRKIALLSIEGVRKGQLNSYTENDVWWTRDEYFSVNTNKRIIQQMIKESLTEKVLAEKAEASAIWQQIESISRQFSSPDPVLDEAVRVSCTYGRIKYELIEQMWILMIANQQQENGNAPDALVVKTALERYDELWKEWRELKDSNPYCATIYTEKAFLNNDKGSIGELIRGLRNRF